MSRSWDFAHGADRHPRLAALNSAMGAVLLLALTMGLMEMFALAHPQPVAAQGGGTSVLTNTIVSDFAVCTALTGDVPEPVLTGSSVSSAKGGELRLAATIEDYFDGTQVDTSQWLAGTVYDWYGTQPTVGNGVLTLESSYLRSRDVFTQSARFFETSALVRADSRDSGWPDLGYFRALPPLDPNSVTTTSSIRLFTMGDGGGNANNMVVRWRDGLYPPLYQGDTDIADPDPFQFHVYRLEWDTGGTSYYIDGDWVADVGGTLNLASWVFLYHQDPTIYDTSPMQVDWVRAGRYTSTGQYVSCAQDAGQSVAWGPLRWDADMPAGTSLSFQTRTSNGTSWSAWSSPIYNSGTSISSPTGRYLQYRVNMTTANPMVSPQVNAVNFGGISLSFSQDSFRVTEADTTVTITATLSAPLSAAASVEYVTANGSATAGSDYNAASGTLSFPAGTTVRTFGVSVLGDTLDEDDETIVLSLRNPSNPGLGTPLPATLTIVDDDPSPSVAFSSAAYSVDEGAGMATVTATLSAASARPVTVTYDTSDGTATAGSDYTTATGQVVFAAGQTRQTFVAPITNDASDEDDETVNLALSSPVNATLGAPNAALLTIVDDDAPPSVAFSSAAYSASEGAGTATITATLDAASGRAVTVTYGTSNGTAMAGSDYTTATGQVVFAAGQMWQTFVAPITNDASDEDDETVNLALSSPVNATLGAPNAALLTIMDDDAPPSVAFSSAAYSASEGVGMATITVTLDAASGRAVTVTYGTSDGTATAGSDYVAATGQVVFAAGQTWQTFAAPITNDAKDEDDETANLALSSPVNATLGAPNAALLTIVDDDAPPSVAFSSAAYSASEGAGTATITATLDAASGRAVTVTYGTSNGTAVAGNDYVAAAGQLVFAAGQTRQAFVAPITNDSTDEDDETVNLALSSPVNATLGAPNAALLTIVDDDAPPSVAFSSAAYSVGEGAGTATVTATLSAASARPVTVTYNTSGGTATAGSDYTTATGQLVFAAGQTSRTFTVGIREDGVVESNETVTLTLSDPANATLGTPNPALLSILDNDMLPTVQFSSAVYSVIEDQGAAVITVTLSNPYALPVTVLYATSDGTAVAGSDYVAASGVLTVPVGEVSQVLNVTVLNDTPYDPDETVNLALSAPVNATLGAPNRAILTIVEEKKMYLIYLPVVMRR